MTRSDADLLHTPAAARASERPAADERGEGTAHLVDVTMFWSPAGGGVGRYLRSKQAWVADHASGWRHTLLVPDAPAPGRAPLSAPPLPFSPGYRFPLRRRDAARRLVQLLPDVIEAGDPYRTAWAALDAGWRLGVPVVAFAHSNVVELARRIGGRFAGRAAQAYLRRLYRQFDAVLAASRWMAGELRELGVDRVVAAPLGVDCGLFDPRRRSERWRARLGLSPRDCVLLYAGRFAGEKNLDALADAVRRLGAHHTLVLIGDGPSVPDGPRVIRLPYESDAAALATAIASADVFVHAGDQETFGLAALEALACGTPVVACAQAGLRELVDERTVVGVARASGEAFAEAIAGVRSSLPAMRDAARVRALEFDHRITFARQFARYEALRASATFAAAPAGEADVT
jgi:alpha-1,6-mannosyltransferase